MKGDLNTGKVPGIAAGSGVDGISFTNIRGLHYLAGPGIATGGSVYAGVGGAFDYMEPAASTPDPYRGWDMSVGVGVGAEIRVQASHSIAVTPGTIIRGIERLFNSVMEW